MLSKDDVQSWYAASTGKSKLALAVQARLEQLGAGFLITDTPTLRKSVFLKVVHVFWIVTGKLWKSLQADYPKAGQSVKQDVTELEDLFGFHKSEYAKQISMAEIKSDLDAAIKTCTNDASVFG